jgi:galactose mutarotase-like enzyme
MGKVYEYQPGYWRIENPRIGSQADFLPARGGICIGFKALEQEIFYLDKATLTDAKTNIRGGNPILFPICGNLQEDSYQVGDTAYTLARHGFARNKPWSVIDMDEGENPSITLELKADSETLASYPFQFRLAFTYRLVGNQLQILQRYENQGDSPMPFSAGFHPYFAILDKNSLEIMIPAQTYRDQVTGATGKFSEGQFSFSDPVIDWIFTDVHAQEAYMVRPKAGVAIGLTYDPVFKYLVFWTLKDKGFCCLEPWMGPRNSLNSGDGVQVLAPGAHLEAQFSIGVQALQR